MAQLREFAQHYDEFGKVKTRVVAISVDDTGLSHQTWEQAAERKITILSDPQATAIKAYGLLDSVDGRPAARRTLVFIDEQGNERWRMPAGMATVAQLAQRIRQTQ